MFSKPDKLDFSFTGKKVKTICKCYATKQKSTINIPKIYYLVPLGSIGEIRVVSTDQEYNIESFLVKFTIEGQYYYCKLSKNMLDFID